MNLAKAEQAIVNGIYAAGAWLFLDLGFLLQEHGAQTLSYLVSRPEMTAGTIIIIACIVGLFYKSRLAAITLFLLLLLPLVFRTVQEGLPSSMLLIFSLILLYFFLTTVLATLTYHQLKKEESDQVGR